MHLIQIIISMGWITIITIYTQDTTTVVAVGFILTCLWLGEISERIKRK